MQQKCSARLISWIIVWLCVIAIFSVIRLFRIPFLLLFKSPNPYFVYSVITWVVKYLVLFSVFVWGNVIFFSLIRNPECAATDVYDPKLLLMAMGHIILISWIIVMVICQMVFFGIMLYAMYRAII